MKRSDRIGGGNARAGDSLSMARLPERTWLTSDLHLGHANIVRYCHRPFLGSDGFPDVELMALDIVERFSALVGPEDTLLVLGDVAMGHVEEHLRWIAELPGHKLLVPGNHDRCWSGHGPAGMDWLRRYEAAGFEEILDPGTDVVRLELGSTTVGLHHFPWYGADREDDRYEDLRPRDDGGWLVHGHVHQRWRQRDRMINVGVDAWGGGPVSAATLLRVIQAGPTDRGALVWGEEDPELAGVG